MGKRTAIFLIMFFSLAFLFSLSIFPPIDESFDQSSFPPSISRSAQYVPSLKLFIDGNDDFHSQASSAGWAGSGTNSSPYVIEGLIFEQVSYWFQVRISNTDVHFRLQNCFFNSSAAWLYWFFLSLENVQNAIISDNIFLDDMRGAIGLSNCSQNRLINNTITGQEKAEFYRTGIELSDSENNFLINNTISYPPSSEHGILLSHSGNNTLIGNNLTNQADSREILALYDSENCILINNTIARTVFGSPSALHIERSPNCVFVSNQLINSTMRIFGSTLEEVIQSQVLNNSINGNSIVFLQNMTNVTITVNETQIILVNCEGVEVEGRDLLEVRIFHSSNLYIHDSTLGGFYASSCSELAIVENSFTPFLGLQTAIFVEFSLNTLITNNTISNCGGGIFLSAAFNCTVANNFIVGGESGIDISSSQNLVISGNTLEQCQFSFTGDRISDFYHVEASNNTIDGGLLVYWANVSDATVPAGVKQLFLVNCHSVEVANQNLVNLKAVYCSTLYIHDNAFSDGIQYCLSFKEVVLSVVTKNIFINVPSFSEELFLFQSWSNTISYNTLITQGGGLMINGGQSNLILGNSIINGALIVINTNYSNITSNIVTNGEIEIDGGNGYLLLNNSVVIKHKQLGYGIRMVDTEDNVLIDNYISNQFGDGILIFYAHGVLIEGNRFVNNGFYGVLLGESCTSITVRNNDFIGNMDPGIFNESRNQAFDTGSNNIFIFNYWSDWLTPDQDNDGIVDNAYLIDGEALNFDSYPRLVPLEDISSHVLIPPKIIFPRSTDTQSNPVLISWIPAMDSLGHSITYSIFYSLDDGSTWILVDSELSHSEYSWDLKSLLASGTVCKIKVVAICSDGLSTFDVTDGSITVKYSNSTNFPNLLCIVVVLIFLNKQKLCKKK